jgi:hypothetical protein
MQLYILQNQLELDGVLVTIPQFFSGGEIKRIPWSEPHSKECTGISSMSCNGFWSCTEQMCQTSFMNNTRYVVTFPLDDQCNQTYESYSSRITSENLIFYNNFISYGSVVLMYILTFCVIFNICIILGTYYVKRRNIIIIILYGIAGTIYIGIIITSIVMLIFEQKFVQTQEYLMNDFRPEVISKSSRNITTTCILMSAIQIIIGLIEYRQLLDYIIYKHEQSPSISDPLINN